MAAPLAVCMIVTAAPGTALAAPDAQTFVQTTADKVLTVLADSSISRAQKEQGLAALFRQNFDIPVIGRFVLGRYWASAKPEQQTRYLALFDTYAVAIYSDRFSRYAGLTFKATEATRLGPNSFKVGSNINRGTGDPPIHVDWTVDDSSGTDEVVDFSVDNLSMRLTERADFSSVIENNGGKIDALITLLEQKIHELAV
jgi:phospholipid transport system substrate-binding protein